jgi:hypothetical protein
MYKHDDDDDDDDDDDFNCVWCGCEGVMVGNKANEKLPYVYIYICYYTPYIAHNSYAQTFLLKV